MLNANNEVTIYDFVEDVFSQPLPNITNAKRIYPAPLGKFIVKTDSCISFYDTITKKEASKIETTKSINLVSWKSNYQFGVIIFKKSITIVTK